MFIVLIIKNLKNKFMLKYLSFFNYEMAYSETRIVTGGLAHIPAHIFKANFLKLSLELKIQKVKIL